VFSRVAHAASPVISLETRTRRSPLTSSREGATCPERILPNADLEPTLDTAGIRERRLAGEEDSTAALRPRCAPRSGPPPAGGTRPAHSEVRPRQPPSGASRITPVRPCALSRR